MTNLNYLEADAALIVACLPEEIDDEITKEQLPLFYTYALLLRAKGVDTQLEDVHDAWAAWASAARPDHPALECLEWYGAHHGVAAGRHQKADGTLGIVGCAA